MLGILLISIIANRFIILRFSPSQFYKLHRYEGQLLYIKAICLGLIVMGVSFLFDAYFGVIDHFSKWFPRSGIAVFSETEHWQECFIFFLLSGFFSILYCVLQRLWLSLRARWLLRGIKNRPSYRELANILLMNSILNDSPLDRLLFLSYVQNM
jgi:hypothetical protein